MNYRTLAYTCGRCGKVVSGVPKFWDFGEGGYLCVDCYNKTEPTNIATDAEFITKGGSIIRFFKRDKKDKLKGIS